MNKKQVILILILIMTTIAFVACGVGNTKELSQEEIKVKFPKASERITEALGNDVLLIKCMYEGEDGKQNGVAGVSEDKFMFSSDSKDCVALRADDIKSVEVNDAGASKKEFNIVDVQDKNYKFYDIHDSLDTKGFFAIIGRFGSN